MSGKRPGGILAPVATIFGGDGQIDEAGFVRNLEFYAGSGLDGVVLLGSNGEFATLSTDERKRVITLGAETIGGRRVVMAGTGSESTRETIAMTRFAAEAGVEYALVVTPHYYKTRYDAAAYRNHYLRVAEASPIPVLIYVMAAYTGVDLASNVIVELSSHPNIVGIKDSGGNAAKVAEIVAGSDPDFAVLAGSANFLYAGLLLGATGGIVALGNVAPQQSADLYRLVRAGELDAARELQLRLIAPNAAVTSKLGIAGLKHALAFVGLSGGLPREPLLPLTDAEEQYLERVLSEAGITAVTASA